jgi:hypothetical protein
MQTNHVFGSEFSVAFLVAEKGVPYRSTVRERSPVPKFLGRVPTSTSAPFLDASSHPAHGDDAPEWSAQRTFDSHERLVTRFETHILTALALEGRLSALSARAQIFCIPSQIFRADAKTHVGAVIFERERCRCRGQPRPL